MSVLYLCKYCGKEIKSDLVFEGNIEDFQKFMDEKTTELSDQCECRKNKVMNEIKIGQEVTVQEDFEIEAALSKNKIIVKAGDKGFVDGEGFIHYITGAARGKIHTVNNLIPKGYDHENIARLIFKRLNNEFNLKDLLEDMDIQAKDFTDEIEDVLTDIF